jgi:DnaJ-class molecular chaperone
MDYYSTLGLQRNASDAEIKKAYRSMAMKYHPDRGGDEKKFKEISQAYEFLSDPQKKQIIDLGGDPNAQPGMGGGQGPFEFHFNTGNTVSYTHLTLPTT